MQNIKNPCTCKSAFLYLKEKKLHPVKWITRNNLKTLLGTLREEPDHTTASDMEDLAFLDRKKEK